LARCLLMKDVAGCHSILGPSGSLNLLFDSTGIKAVGEVVMCQFARHVLDKKPEAP
jgi:hypothetical protein